MQLTLGRGASRATGTAVPTFRDFSPHTTRTVRPRTNTRLAVLDGLAAGSDDAAGAGLIIGVNRMLPVPVAERSLELALAYRDRGVVGLGLAADEARFPASLFASVFARAVAVGLPAVPHAGEGAGQDCAGRVREEVPKVRDSCTCRSGHASS